MPKSGLKAIVRAYQAPEEDVQRELQEACGEWADKPLDELFAAHVREFRPQGIVPGRVISAEGDEVIVDIGFKSDAVLDRSEFEEGEDIQVGMEFDVLLETLEDDWGGPVVSKRKADRQKAWNEVISRCDEGSRVSGTVLRKIKGGLLVDIGVPAFLPASQVSIRRAGDIADFIGREVDCKIIKIDQSRMNIVVSVRKLIEEQRARLKEGLLADLVEGQTRTGVVKNIVDFGAFVDLGGIDGLLHITDMTWGRITHPSEMLRIDQTLQVQVLKVDRHRERIALGLKQLTTNPWSNVIDKFPVDSRHKGEVVNLMSYGAFVKLEEGVEGLVHVSEMSWTRRVQHPSEVVKVGDEVDVVVLDVNRDKQEISLGMKQTETNPWALVENKYPIGTVVRGQVRNLTNYGAFVELEEGIDGLLHVSDMSWTRKVTNPAEVVKKSDVLDCVVLSVAADRKRVALGLKQLREDPWKHEIPDKYTVGQMLSGAITKITNFGVFVELEPDLEGLLHISELSATRKVKNPEKLVKEGQVIEVEIIKLDIAERRIGLTLSGDLPEPAEDEDGAPAAADAAADSDEAASATTPEAETEAETADEHGGKGESQAKAAASTHEHESAPSSGEENPENVDL